jgi:cell wall-associated NlpC family hydrolase
MVILLALAAAAVPQAVVLRPVANMYSRPDLDADVVSQAIYGANVGVVERKGDWLQIRTADDYTGWVEGATVRSGATYATSGKVAQVDSMFAHIYREPSVTRHAPVVTVPYETHLEIVGDGDESGRWFQLRLPDDRPGWVQRGDVTLEPAKLSIPEMIELSKRFIGLPYTWGGTSSFGYDCSGFVQMLCRRRGVMLPRDAGPQAKWSGVVPVAREELQPGDLLYFGRSEDKITHTGLYIGDGKFINATAHDKPMVQICDLSDSHWTELLVASRRVK